MTGRIGAGLTGLWVIIVGLVIFGIAGWLVWGEAELVQNGVTTNGQVTRHSVTSDAESGNTYYLDYQFTANDRTYQGQDEVPKEQYESIADGGSIPIRYLPYDPQRSDVFDDDPPHDQWALMLGIGGVVAGGFILVGIAILQHGLFPKQDVIPLPAIKEDRIFTPTDPSPKRPIDLTKRFNFNSNDLAYNQQGMLSGRQRRRLGGMMVATIGCLTLLAAIFLGMMFLASKDLLGQDNGPLCWGIGIAVIGVFLFVKLGPHLHELLPPTNATPVQQVQGLLTKALISGDEGSHEYFLHIGGERLKVDQSAYQSFQAGQHYIIYYVDLLGQQMPVSAEQITTPL